MLSDICDADFLFYMALLVPFSDAVSPRVIERTLAAVQDQNDVTQYNF
jgi:hypothetical protein